MNPKITYISALLDCSGYAEAARNYVLAIMNAGLNVECLPISFENFKSDLGETGNKIKKLSVKQGSGNIQIIHTTPPVYKKYIDKSKYNIGLSAWETSSLPADWVGYINELNEVWVPSSYNVEVFKNSGVTIPMHLIPHTFPIEEVNVQPLQLSSINEDDFVFYAMSQWTARKGFDAVLKAYLTEFQNDEKVALILKTYLITPGSQSEKENIINQVKDIKAKLYLKKYPKVVLISEMLSKEQILQLHELGDCCLSFHKSEGWGLTATEAMLSKNPVIATDYSGTTDFINNDTGYPVSYQLTPVFGMPWENYKGTDFWADINIIDAKHKMRYVYEHQEEAKKVGQKGREYVITNFSHEKVGNLIKERIDKICNR